VTTDHPIVFLFAVAFAGFSLGFGVVIGAFVARSLRRYMETDDYLPYARRPRRRPEDDVDE
jgi:hypothetical protein